MAVPAARIGLILAALATAGDAVAQDAVFRSPSNNIHCMLDSGMLRCDLRQNAAPRPRPPRDCDADYGNSFGLRASGPPIRLCIGDTVMGPHPVLGYGQSWAGAGIRCVMETIGITCTNRTGRGFRLRRDSQDLF